MSRSNPPSDRPDLVWGIQSSPGPISSLPKQFAVLAGVVYLLGGVIGFFFTGFSNFTEYNNVSLFGLLHLTPYHNIVHIGVGALWLLGAFVLTLPAIEGLNLAVAGVYVLAAILGYYGQLGFLGIFPQTDADNFLHLITGVVTLLFSGIIPFRDRAAASAGY